MFPVEIIDKFLQELANDNESLAPFLLVSNAFRYTARPFIFRTINWTFNIARRDALSALLLNILQNDPSIVPLIRHLHITFSTSKSHNDGLFDPNIPALLQVLGTASIQTLKLRASEDDPFAFSKLYSNMEITARLFFLRCQPSLRTLVLDSLWSVPRMVVVGIPAEDGLAHLSMTNVGSSIDAGPIFPFSVDTLPQYLCRGLSSSDHPPLPKLESLSVPYPGHFTSYFFPDSHDSPVFTYDLPSLRSLTCGQRTYQASYQHEAISLLFTKASNLESVSLEERFLSSDVLDASCPIYKIKGLRKLRELHLTTTRGSNEEHLHVQAVSQMLDICIPFRALEVLSLTLSWDVKGEPNVLEDLFITDDNGGWFDLQDTLLHIPTLRKFILTINLTLAVDPRFGLLKVDKEYKPFNDLLEFLSLDGRVEVEDRVIVTTRAGR